MPSPQGPPPDVTSVTAHAMGVLDFVLRVGAVLGASWVGVARIAKPYVQWRRDHHRDLTIEVLAPELSQLKEFPALKGICQQILAGQEEIIQRQNQVFREMDHFHTIATINNERLDEINLFLDSIGFTSDRRSKSAEAQRKVVDDLLSRLRARKLARDRGDIPTDTDEHPIPGDSL